MIRRDFVKLLVGGIAVAAAPAICKKQCCGALRPDGQKYPVLTTHEGKHCCVECGTVDEINSALYVRGLRPCPHSYHSSDEHFVECAYDRFLKSLELSVKEIVRRDHAPFERIEIDPPHEGFRLVKLSVEGNPVPYTWKLLYEL
jgi:hypothetical protein